jgi:predicted nucleotidyltransferase
MTRTATQNSYIATLQRFKQEYGAQYGITQIGFFGSVARGEDTDGSDVDVIVEAPGLGLFAMAGMRLKLEEIFNKSVDLVVKSEYMRERFKNRIEKEAIYV